MKKNLFLKWPPSFLLLKLLFHHHLIKKIFESSKSIKVGKNTTVVQERPETEKSNSKQREKWCRSSSLGIAIPVLTKVSPWWNFNTITLIIPPPFPPPLLCSPRDNNDDGWTAFLKSFFFRFPERKFNSSTCDGSISFTSLFKRIISLQRF